MPPTIQVAPSPFLLNGGSVGILLIHGFTGAPPEMRLIGDYLHKRDITVSGTMLPGHGTSADDMNKYTWIHWVDHARQALTDLCSVCDAVFVAGLSLGSLITLTLAAENIAVSGAILYSPAIKLTSRMIYLTPFFKYLVRKVKKPEAFYADPQARRRNWSYDQRPLFAAHELLKIIKHTKAHLPKVKCPLLMIQSTIDETIDAKSSQIIYGHVKSAYKEIVMLHHSGHCLTIDGEWEVAAKQTYQFMMKYGDMT
jgi:carboxylesterase